MRRARATHTPRHEHSAPNYPHARGGGRHERNTAARQVKEKERKKGRKKEKRKERKGRERKGSWMDV